VRHIDGKQVNRTLRPGAELERVREGIANYRKLQELLGDLLAQEESQVLESGRAAAPAGKKTSRGDRRSGERVVGSLGVGVALSV
jgi:hypothetical protein